MASRIVVKDNPAAYDLEQPLAGVKVDSELMMMLEGAIPVPSTSRFVSVLDDASRPIVFSIGNDNKFYCIKLDDHEIRRVYDLGNYFGITESVVAMYVTRGKDGTLYIAFATDHNVYIVKPVKPVDINPEYDELKTNLVKAEGVPSNVHITKMFVNEETDWSRDVYPLICAIYHEGNNEARGIAAVLFDGPNAIWHSDYCTLPKGTMQVIDFTPARTINSEGIFALCLVNNNVKVVVTDFPKSLVFDASEGARAIDMFIDDSGHSRCVVAGKGLWVIQEDLIKVACELYSGGKIDKYDGKMKAIAETLVSNDQSLKEGQKKDVPGDQEDIKIVDVHDISKTAKWTKISSDPFYDIVDNLFIAQVQDNLSIYNQKFPPVPLRPEGKGAEFAAMLDPKTNSQIVIVADKDGGLTLFEQASDTRLWKDTPFNVPSMDHNAEFMAYNTRITVIGKDNQPVIHQKFILGCSSWLYCSVNGRCKLITRDGIEVMTDAGGAITIINRTADFSSYHFFLQDAKGNDFIPGTEPVFIDPAEKAMAKLGRIRNEYDLRNLKLEDGTPLIPPGASAADVRQAAQTIAGLNSMLTSAKTNEKQSFLADFTKGSREIAQGGAEALTGQFGKGGSDVLKGGTDIAKSGFGLMRGIAKSVVPAPPPREKEWYEKAWDWIVWVRSKIKDVVSWVVERVQDVWRFIVKIGETLYNFIVETAIQVQKVFVFIFEKIGVAVQTVIKWLGFVFSWGDIVDTSLGIANMTNSFLDWAIEGVGKGADLIDQNFDTLEKAIRNAANVPDTSKLKGRPNSLKDTKSSGGLDHSAAVNVGKYHYQHSGVHQRVDQLQVMSVSGDTEVFKNKFVEEINKLKAQLDQLGQVWRDYFSGKKDMTVGDFFRTLGVETLLLILSAIKALFKAVVGISVDLIKGIKKLSNMKITVPILTPVFRLITKGQDLTVINVISLLLAIPTTILAKIITNDKPNQVTRNDFKGIMQSQGLTDESLKAYYELSNYVRFSHFFYKGLTDVVSIYKSMAPPTPASAAEPPFSLFSPMLPVFGQVYGYPVDRSPPLWDVRISLWGVGCGAIIIKATCQKLSLGERGFAFTELMTALLSFSLSQWVHDREYNTNWKDKDKKATDMSVSMSVFELLEVLATATGVFAPEPASKTVCAAGTALMNAAVCGLQVGKIVYSHKKGDFEYAGGRTK